MQKNDMKTIEPAVWNAGSKPCPAFTMMIAARLDRQGAGLAKLWSVPDL